MVSLIVPRYYENLEVLHDNTMQPRAYYIPASVRMDDLVENRERSDRFQLLNGEWKFKYFESIYEVTDSFYEEGYDISGFDKIMVPGVWQMAGYDRHQYTNIRYPFPFDPPYVPQDNPCGAYVRTFSYHREEHAPKSFLNFEGVDSCFYVWINGIYIGYSQVSHTTSEFDASDVLREGNNTMAVLVLKWCDGSYLEDQDKFRMSGIFRDVYLLKRPEKAIRDYHITTEVGKERAIVRIDIQFTEPVATKLQLEDPYGVIVAEGEIAENGVAELDIVDPILWNTENPYLYKVIFTAPDEVIVDHIGLRTIAICNAVMYINGVKLKFRGVNRHDSDPETGSVTSVDQIKTDLTLMKQHNVNAIRSSHYPNVPYFYQMCDQYGFMVIDEADIEAHGPFMLYRKEDTEQNRFQRWNERIADDPVWEAAIMDRVKCMIARDKNRSCVVMWSMGNESAYGCNFEKALKWTKAFDPERMTQYESARYRNYDVTYNYEDLDMYSRMYPALSEIEKYLEIDGSKKAHYDAAYTRAYTVEILQNQHGVFIMEHLAVLADSVQKILDTQLIWKITESGGITASFEVEKDAEFPDLPRFGIRLFLNRRFDEVSYFGMGPQESYRDKHQAASHGLYCSKVWNLHEDYIKPQENGSHFDCDYVEVTNGQSGLAVAAEHAFSFNASKYTQEELERAAHNYELEESDSTVLCIDYAMNGIGSNSCGPVVSDVYRFKEDVFTFQLTMVPFGKR